MVKKPGYVKKYLKTKHTIGDKWFFCPGKSDLILISIHHLIYFKKIKENALAFSYEISKG